MVAIFVLTGGGAAWAVNLRATTNDQEITRQDTSFAAKRAAIEIDEETSELRVTVATLAANPGLKGVLTDPSRCAVTFSALGPFSSGRYDVTRLDGSVACSSSAPSAGSQAASYSEIAWFTAAGSGPMFEAPVADPVTRLPSLLVTVPMAGGGGVIVGLAALTPVGPGLAAQLGGRRNLEFLVVAKDGKTVLARSLNPGKWSGSSLTGTPFNASLHTLQGTSVDGTPTIYGRATAANTGWTVFAGDDTASVLAASKTLLEETLLIIGIGLLILLGATYLLYRSLARPIQALRRAVRAGIGHESGGRPAVGGPSEVVELASEFYDLLASVEAELNDRLRAESQVQTLNVVLSEQVKEGRKQLRELERINRERADLSARLRDLLERHTGTVEAERYRIATEIHDDTIQVIAAVGMRLERLKKGAGDERQLTLIAEVEEAIRLASRRLRNLTFDLLPPSLEQPRGLQTVLMGSLKQLQSDTGIDHRLTSGLDRDIDTAKKLVLFRIAQEALANVRKHSQATRVRVEIKDTGDGVEVSVIDNGVGFDFRLMKSAPGHLGLIAMQERAQSVGGWWRCTGQRGGGVRVQFWVPA
jgi:signal transduction histidine kinase